MAGAGIGVDIIEISRMEAVLQKTPSFSLRFFTSHERSYCEGKPRPGAHFACLFAAREAVLKSLGAGYGQGVGRWDVSVSFDEHDHPSAVLSGGAAAIAKDLGVIDVALSLSFTNELAVANAMAITAEARPKPKIEPVDEREILAQSFKESRSLVDELERAQDAGLIASSYAELDGDRRNDDETSS